MKNINKKIKKVNELVKKEFENELLEISEIQSNLEYLPENKQIELGSNKWLNPKLIARTNYSGSIFLHQLFLFFFPFFNCYYCYFLLCF